MYNLFADALSNISNFMYSNIIIYLLIFAGFYFTYKTKFVQVRLFKESIKLVGEKNEHEPKDNKNQISSFQAFTISTASRVGTGNIAGIAIAIARGGPGAIFWMWAMALFSASSGFIESTLAQIYKVKDGESFRGGPAHYIEKALKLRWLSVLFAILTAITFGLIFNIAQSNTISLVFSDNINPIWIGIILSSLTLLIIFGGVKRIAHITSFLVPIMAILYILMALFVVLFNLPQFFLALRLIITSAFGIEQVVAGGIGYTVQQGIRRGLFSNEAGMGSSPNAAATASVSHPVKQGLVQSFSVFVDTFLICSATAFIVIISGMYQDTNLTGIVLTQMALYSFIGNAGSIFITICISLFAFSSILGNYYYGQSNIQYITKNKSYVNIYRIFVGLVVLFAPLLSVAVVWDLADIFMGLMAIINIIVLFMISKITIGCLNDYEKQRKEGKDPVFYEDSIPGLNTECWKRPE